MYATLPIRDHLRNCSQQLNTVCATETSPALDHVPGSSWLERTIEADECLPYLVHIAIRSCRIILTAEVLHSLIPAAALCELLPPHHARSPTPSSLAHPGSPPPPLGLPPGARWPPASPLAAHQELPPPSPHDFPRMRPPTLRLGSTAWALLGHPSLHPAGTRTA
ncbi:uncharacterized protein BXZ73DRAFT_105107 [Epithele typhae]|uniref:uncharacterized protein n=1 Tax=Epithele typhae TaxID=378194 RepID=UPI002007B836|nr:uncharacterized protein BXZ73DRAFT_105107 [Epithele typhae]KAH9918709.1 hypothetical protein BXZ73DRAFT_105107 [Epithele typhae]